jgi:hypothetical protein
MFTVVMGEKNSRDGLYSMFMISNRPVESKLKVLKDRNPGKDTFCSKCWRTGSEFWEGKSKKQTKVEAAGDQKLERN